MRIIHGSCGDCRHAIPTDGYCCEVSETLNLICTLMSNRNEEPVRTDTMALAVDYESQCADTLVSPDFGCVMWEGKT